MSSVDNTVSSPNNPPILSILMIVVLIILNIGHFEENKFVDAIIIAMILVLSLEFILKKKK